MFEPPIITLRSRVVGTRSLARQFVAEHAAEVNPALAVYIDCRGVEVITSPWIEEVLDAWPYATAMGANEDVSDTWAMVLTCRGERT